MQLYRSGASSSEDYQPKYSELLRLEQLIPHRPGSARSRGACAQQGFDMRCDLQDLRLEQNLRVIAG